MTRELRVVCLATKEIVRRVPITGDKSDRQVEKVMSGMLRNMNTDEYCVEDSADDASQPAKE